MDRKIKQEIGTFEFDGYPIKVFQRIHWNCGEFIRFEGETGINWDVFKEAYPTIYYSVLYRIPLYKDDELSLILEDRELYRFVKAWIDSSSLPQITSG